MDCARYAFGAEPAHSRITERNTVNLLKFHCSIDLALTYALRRPALARSLAWDALMAAVAIGRPDLSWRATELIGVLS